IFRPTACALHASHACGRGVRSRERLVRLARPRTPLFQGGNTGSNPVRDATSFSLVYTQFHFKIVLGRGTLSRLKFPKTPSSCLPLPLEKKGSMEDKCWADYEKAYQEWRGKIHAAVGFFARSGNLNDEHFGLAKVL